MPDLAVYVVDDDAAVRDSLALILRLEGYRVETLDSAEAFLDAGAAQHCDCLLLDLRMPGMDGLQLLDSLNADGTCPPVILFTGDSDRKLLERAQIAGARTVLSKPLDQEILLDHLRRLDDERQS